MTGYVVRSKLGVLLGFYPESAIGLLFCQGFKAKQIDKANRVARRIRIYIDAAV